MGDMDSPNTMKICEMSGIHHARPPYYICKWCGRKELPTMMGVKKVITLLKAN